MTCYICDASHGFTGTRRKHGDPPASLYVCDECREEHFVQPEDDPEKTDPYGVGTD